MQNSIALRPPLLEDMLTAAKDILDPSYVNDISKYDWALISNRSRDGDQILWIFNRSSSLATFLSPASAEVLEHPDGLRAFRSSISLVISQIEREGWKNCYLINITDAATTFGEMTPLEPAQAIDLCRQVLAKTPEPPPLDRSDALVIQDQEYYDLVLANAEAMGLAGQLKQKLEHLKFMSSYQWYRCLLFKDFANLSFYWIAEIKHAEDGEWKRYMNGGLIFHEYDKSWSIHT